MKNTVVFRTERNDHFYTKCSSMGLLYHHIWWFTPSVLIIFVYILCFLARKLKTNCEQGYNLSENGGV